MRTYYAYIRVSTVKQGERGSSLQEQRAAIEQFAQRAGIVVTEWFEEKETAAKQGRTLFRRMLGALEKGKAHGVVIHKIDRGARNLRDWADLGMLIDRGIEVHFANENLDLHSRGGRLSADIQAVVAADFIRNLREEVRKGMYGRLKQGFYPLQSPVGYVDNGAAKPKTICPVRGPLVRRAFELYATGNYSLETLFIELQRIGLTNKRGRNLHRNGVAYILHNPFYYGLMRIKRTGESFIGNHEPLISKELFDRVQAALQKSTKVKSGYRRSYLLQRMMCCTSCGNHLYAEVQKGNTYYRCHTRTCPATCVREDSVLSQIGGELASMRMSEEKLSSLGDMFRIIIGELEVEEKHVRTGLALRLSQIDAGRARLTDAYLENAIDRDELERRKTILHSERLEIEEKLRTLGDIRVYEERQENFLELIKSLCLLDILGNPAEKREILKTAISNLSVSRKNVAITWDIPIHVLFDTSVVFCGEPKRDESRTFVVSEVVRCALRDVLLGKG